MNTAELADLIEDRYTPFAFKCSCGGTHPDCSQAKQDPATWAQYDTVLRITKLIRGMA